MTYTRVFQGEEKTVTESYVINTQPAWLETTGNPAIAQNFMTAKVTTPAPRNSQIASTSSTISRSRCARESRGLEQSRGRRLQ